MNEKIKTNFTELNDYTCRWHHSRVCDAGIIDREGITRGIWQVETEMVKAKLDPQNQNSLYRLHTTLYTRRRRVYICSHPCTNHISYLFQKTKQKISFRQKEFNDSGIWSQPSWWSASQSKSWDPWKKRVLKQWSSLCHMTYSRS